MPKRITLRYSNDAPSAPFWRQIERLARADRLALKCGFGEPCDPRRLTELYDVSIILESYDQYTAHFARDMRQELKGMQHWSGALIRIGQGDHMLLANPAQSQTRRTLTLAHEFGHLCHGHTPSKVTDESGLPSVIYNSAQERQAYAYALAILLPYAPLLQLLQQGASLSGIAHLYAVSVKAVEVRLAQAGLTGLSPNFD